MSLPTRPRRSALYLPGINTRALAVVDGVLIENLHARDAERLLALAAAIAAKSNLPPEHP